MQNLSLQGLGQQPSYKMLEVVRNLRNLHKELISPTYIGVFPMPSVQGVIVSELSMRRKGRIRRGRLPRRTPIANEDLEEIYTGLVITDYVLAGIEDLAGWNLEKLRSDLSKIRRDSASLLFERKAPPSLGGMTSVLIRRAESQYGFSLPYIRRLIEWNIIYVTSRILNTSNQRVLNAINKIRTMRQPAALPEPVPRLPQPVWSRGWRGARTVWKQAMRAAGRGVRRYERAWRPPVKKTAYTVATARAPWWLKVARTAPTPFAQPLRFYTGWMR